MKGCLKVFFAVVILSIALCYTSFWYLNKRPKGTINLKSIKGGATIRFDGENGVPYITGDNKQSVLFALGYVHAMDHLYDLFSKRLLAYGRVSEAFGESSLGLDKYMRSVQLEKACDRDLKNLGAEDKELLEAYVDGVNAYAEEMTILPPEFLILGAEFEKWTVKDALMTMKMVSFSFSCGWNQVILRSAVEKIFGKEMAERIVSISEENSFMEQVRIIQDEDLERMGFLKKVKTNLQGNKETEKPVDEHKQSEEKTDEQTTKKAAESTNLKNKISAQEKTASKTTSEDQNTKPYSAPPGSNAWVISGNHTESGYPILSSDPHMYHNIPSILYFASFKIPGGPNIFGGSVPGTPWAVIGRNDHAAWGATLSYLEASDYFIIEHNKTHYFYNNSWVPLVVSRHKIKIKNSEPVYYESYSTHHGPIQYIPVGEERELIRAAADTAFIDKPLAIAWSGLREVDRIVPAYRLVNYAATTEEILAAAKQFDSFGVSFVFGMVISGYIIEKW